MTATFLEPDVVRALLKGPERRRIMVLDVRDEDYAGKGGHIAGCVHFSVDNFEEKQLIDDFIRQRLVGSGVETVIVHCYLCEQRGPCCAKRLASRLQCLEMKEPRVYILRSGFKGFQERYSTDTELIVGDDEELGSNSSASSVVGAPESCCYPVAGGMAQRDYSAAI